MQGPVETGMGRDVGVERGRIASVGTPNPPCP